ncbi:MAG: sucrase-isomaltase, partial [Mycoplasmataceae bacterium]|nr:sucrase-isomaltase [Mycoplasmataceae bacterium]
MNIKKDENIKFKVGYQIFPISFKDSNNDGIGDLKGIEEKLPYLKELGIDIIWLCPIYKSNFADAGYDVINYCEIDPKFGTMDDFDSLMKNAKK